MPPKLRRPAAHVRGAGRRRPAAQIEAADVAGDGGYQKVSGFSPPQLFEFGTLAIKGKYWDASCELAGEAKSLERVDGRTCLRLEVAGTRHENFLKYLSGQVQREVVVALPSPGWEAPSWANNVVVAEDAKKVQLDSEPWMKNLQEVREPGDANEVDETAALRREALQTSLAEGGPKKRDKEEKKRKRSRSRKRRRRSSTSREERRSKKKKRVRAKSQVAVSVLFNQTGSDPDPKIREQFMRRARRLGRDRNKGRRRRRSSSGSVESSSSSSTEPGSLKSRTQLFAEGRRVQEIADNYPGTLANAWLEDCQEYLVTSQGHQMDCSQGPITPMATLYFRSQVATKVSPPMAREYMTLATIVDRMLQGKPSIAMDYAVQRMKSLEAVSQGVHYSVANQFELIRMEKTMAASAPETQMAAKQAREEEKILQQAGRPVSRTFRQDLPAPDKGSKGKGKRKGKDSDHKGKGEAKNNPTGAKKD